MHDHAKALFGSWRDEIRCDCVKGLIGDATEEDARRLRIVALVNIGQALGIGRLDHVQDVIRVRRFENAARPLSALQRVAGKVEDDGNAQAQ